ncbi:MAG: hypothetical protein WHX60_08590 [Armatimonadota bacterium]
MARKGWIQKAIKRPGAFRQKAQARGMSTREFAQQVKANPKRYDARTRKQASLALTLMNMNKRRGKKR